MTRISDLGFQQILLNSFQRAQGSAQLRQIQLSTGRVSDRYSGVGVTTGQLLSAEGVMERVSAYEKAAGVAASRLEMQEAALTTIADSVARLRERFVVALSTGSAELIAPELASEAQRIIGALNTESGGVYVFGGVDGTIISKREPGEPGAGPTAEERPALALGLATGTVTFCSLITPSLFQ